MLIAVLLECVVIPLPSHHVCTLHVCFDWWILCDFSPFVCKKVLRRRSVVPTTSMRVIIAMLLCTSLWRAWLDENLTNGVGCGVQMYTILDGYYVYMLSCAIPIPLPSVLCTALLRYPHKKCLNIVSLYSILCLCWQILVCKLYVLILLSLFLSVICLLVCCYHVIVDVGWCI
jgi:hypothetical protein